MAQNLRAPALTGRDPPLHDRDSELPLVADGPVAAKTWQRQRMALGLLLFGSFLAVARLAAPVWGGMVLGALMAFTAQPLYRQLTSRLGERRKLAALLTTALSGLLCVVAGALALYVLTRELFGVIAVMQK